ncbi:hypothetical protein B296_00053397 [Ensete ventricosum]|uniref:Uncharacterized protein n=1 Tax=Ensete ventricosum TaxID=4639 RepID=A0A426WZH7_ENSVE|nr:hypothetical protein B296_00053397 [Ensete ventricosum]
MVARHDVLSEERSTSTIFLPSVVDYNEQGAAGLPIRLGVLQLDRGQPLPTRRVRLIHGQDATPGRRDGFLHAIPFSVSTSSWVRRSATEAEGWRRAVLFTHSDFSMTGE